MSKTNEELATEITVAWIKAVGDCCTSGNFASDWLEAQSIENAYVSFHTSICNSGKNYP